MQKILGYLRKAVHEFDLLQDGDVVAVGVSGGMLLAMRCDALRIGKRTVRGGVVAFSPTPVSDGGGYTALIGGSI